MRRVNQIDFTWLYYINDSPDRNIRVQWNTTDSPDRNIGVQYNIYKWIHFEVKIHQHSLLTRKVFSWQNSSAKVFFSRSSLKLDHHWIIIKSRSSLDYHQRWIITRSSSKLDHHWIIIKVGSSLLLLFQSTGVVSQFYSSHEVLQIQPFFMLVVCLASMQVFIFCNTYI